MNRKLVYILVIKVILCSGCSHLAKEDKKEYFDCAAFVNPFIGASTSADAAGVYHGLGKTFPGAATPFGMVQLSPNTITGGDNGSGYSYEHTTIEGFALTQMSGAGWNGDLGNFLVMPTTGEMKTSAGSDENPDEGYRSRYIKDSERASAGYYSVVLEDYKIKAEMTATTHCGMYRFTFPENDKSRIQIDLARRVGGTSTFQNIEKLDENTITGWMVCPPEGGGWGNGLGKSNYKIYFYAQFSKPLNEYGVWEANIPEDWTRKLEDVTSGRYQKAIADSEISLGLDKKDGKHLGFFTIFHSNEGEQVTLKVGVSFISQEGAKNNLEQEINHWDFDQVKETAYDSWNKALQKMQVVGGSVDEKTVFYTALYHSMIDPRTFEDADNHYFGGDKQVHKSDNFTKRTIFSGWDVFRSQFPLQTLINPTIVNDMLNSLTTLAEESGKGYFERWELLNAYSGCMIGNPAISVLADAHAKDIRKCDIEKAYQTAIKTCEYSGNEKLGFTVRSDAESSGSAGYAIGEFSISNTLELSYTEWCTAQLAKSLGKEKDYTKYMKLSQSYKNVFDQEVGWFRARNENGSWKEWPETGRIAEWHGTVECNPYQQGWFVPHDVDGMVELMGGREKVRDDLNHFFEQVPENMMWNDYYNHANEPVHHIPFLYNRLGIPWQTQKWTREICKRAYKNKVEGLVGNEDVGQMSAWYVLAAIGLHQICPGDLRYEITSPVFKEITIQLDKEYATGKTFTIKAKNNSKENIYIQRASLNGKELNRCYLDFNEISIGGILELEMGSTPNKNWGLE